VIRLFDSCLFATIWMLRNFAFESNFPMMRAGGDFSVAPVDLWFIILMHMKIVKFHLGGSKMVFVTEMKIDSRMILRFLRYTAACGKWHFCARTCRTKVSLIGMMNIIREIPRKQNRNCVSIPTITTYEQSRSICFFVILYAIHADIHRNCCLDKNLLW